MAWRKLEATFHGNPKSKRLARRLEIGRATARGLISGLWSWALLHAPDGDLVGFDGEDIAEAVDFDGDADDLIRALVEVRVLDREGDRLSIHNWLERGGSYAEKVRKRLERQRQSSKNVQDSLGQTKTVQDEKGQSENVEDRPKMSGTKTDSPGPSENVAVRREEKRREENILPSAVTVSSTSLLARADDAPQQKDRDSDWLNQFSNLREIEGAGYDRYGALTGGAIAAVRNLLPITRDELDAAKSTKGKSWAYMAKVVANYREQNNETANSLAAVDTSDAGDFIDDFYSKWGPNGTERQNEF